MYRWAIILGVLAGLLFGVATPLSKILLNTLNSFEAAGLLYLGAFIGVAPFVLKDLRQKECWQGILRNRNKILSFVFFGGMLGPLLLMLGLKTAHSASVSIWLNLELVWTVLLGWLFFRESFDKVTLLGMLLALAAGVTTSIGEGFHEIIPALLIAGACFCWAIDNQQTGSLDTVTPQMATFIKGLVAGSINFTIGCFIAGKIPVPEVISGALVIGIFAYGASIAFYVICAQNIGASRSQILFSTAPFWGVLLAWVLLGEPILFSQIIAMILLLTGVIAVNVLRHGHEHKHEETEHIHYHTHDDQQHNHHDELLSNARHMHLHSHITIEHSHKHFPDLHHRHKHV